MQPNRILTVMLIIAALITVSNSAVAQLPPPFYEAPSMTIYTEENGSDIELSSAALIPNYNGIFMPEVWTSIGVRTLEKGVPVPVGVAFTASPSNLLVFQNGVQGTMTNNRGRGRVIVKGNGRALAGIADNTPVQIVAKWKDTRDRLVAQKVAYVILRTTPPAGTFCSFFTNPVHQSRPVITYNANSVNLGKAASLVPISISTYTLPPKISWSSVTSGGDLRLRSVYQPGWPGLARAYPAGTFTQIEYNLANCDGDHFADLGQPPMRDIDYIMPWSWRHNLQATSNHEFAHALGLNHSAKTQYLSVVADTTWHYYVGARANPGLHDLNTIQSNY